MQKSRQFGMIVRTHRRQQKLFIEKLAELCNVSSRCIANIELNKSIPKADTFISLCLILHINLDDIQNFTFTKETLENETHLSVY